MALNFIATNNTYVNFGASPTLELLADKTICGWIYPHSLGANNTGYIIIRSDYNIAYSGYQLNLDPTGFGFHDGNSSSSVSCTSSPIVLNCWNFIAVTKQGTTGNIYSGQKFCSNPQFNTIPLVSNASMTSTIATSAPVGIIGNNTINSLTRAFDGLISDLRIYNRALSTFELQTIFWSDGIDHIINGLKARWILLNGTNGSNAGGSNTVIDCSGNANHGTPYSSPIWTATPIRMYNS
jgi:hypothetical protein